MTPLQKEAIAAVEAYYDAAMKGTTERSSAAMRKLYAPGCAPCESLADRIDDLRAENQRVLGSSITASNLTAMEGSGAGIGVQGRLRASPAQLVDSDGRVVQQFPESVRSPVVWLLRADGNRLLLVDIRAD